MKLEKFKVTNFRSIHDSGPIAVAAMTALLGRNESGKSNLLRALHSLNPSEGFKALVAIKDFPRHRRLEECKSDTPVVTSTWLLDASELESLEEMFPRAKGVTHVEIGRSYGTARTVRFINLPPLAMAEAEIKTKVKKAAPAIQVLAATLDVAKKTALEKATDVFEKANAKVADQSQWAKNIAGGCSAIRQALAVAGVELDEKQIQAIVELESIAEATVGDGEAYSKARTWAIETLPVFIYVDEYPELQGSQDIAGYLTRKQQNVPTVADKSFEKLCKVAGLNPQNLQELLSQNQAETRNQLVNRASAVVTSEIKRLWKDRPLKIRFNIDAQHLDTLISDPNAKYDVEVSLDDRSRGFQWFFAFYIAFSADTNGGKAEDAVLLLDEPGLYLHAKSRADLLAHFEHDYKNQIVFTTHSPFMVPTHKLDAVRTVNISEDDGTTVTNDPTGDSRTLFPLQAALGYNLAQSLFVGPYNLVVEGVTDFWFISAISNYLKEQKLASLNPDVVVTPAGGAQKVSYMVALLTSQKLGVLVLLDKEKDSVGTKDDLVKSKLIAEKNIVFVSEAIQVSPPDEADIEDLLEPGVYESLVRDAYVNELKGKTLVLNPKIPRIAKRFEAALKALGIEFHKTRPARLFLSRIGSAPASVVSGESAKRFEALFEIVNQRVAVLPSPTAGSK